MPRAAQERARDSGVLGGQRGAAGGVTGHQPPTHSRGGGGGKDRGVLVPLLPVTAAGWMVVPGALRSLHLTSTKETVLPAASAPACLGP